MQEKNLRALRTHQSQHCDANWKNSCGGCCAGGGGEFEKCRFGRRRVGADPPAGRWHRSAGAAAAAFIGRRQVSRASRCGENFRFARRRRTVFALSARQTRRRRRNLRGISICDAQREKVFAAKTKPNSQVNCQTEKARKQQRQRRAAAKNQLQRDGREIV